MSTPWHTMIFDALEALDQKEAPHGLYGMRQAHSAGARLPKLSQLIGAGTKEYLRSNGCRVVQGPSGANDFRFMYKVGKCVALQVLDYATTKVREYGLIFRVDEHHRKQVIEPAWELEKLISKLASKRQPDVIRGILLISHFHDPKEIDFLLGRSADQEFLQRYQISHFLREWSDRYGRGFSTTIQLWEPNGKSTNAGVAA